MKAYEAHVCWLLVWVFGFCVGCGVRMGGEGGRGGAYVRVCVYMCLCARGGWVVCCRDVQYGMR
eukprot:m.113332 g.113332  ORF g.113332 m.113332 type:complete len:64 (+) comp28264_c2_seq1:361-552(+)